jgi:PAS domain S-box-containing protein
VLECALAAAISIAALAIQWVMHPSLHPAPFLILWLAVLLAGWRAGWAPGLLALAITSIGADILFLLPVGSPSVSPRDLATVGMFVLIGLLTTKMNVVRLNALRTVREREEWLRTTLASIGDAVIATDREGRVQFLNEVAQNLIGWTAPEVIGRSIEDVFRIVNEATREPVENPVRRVLREGRVVGLANHTALVSRSGREYVIEDSGAPIRDADGAVIGVVLVFHDTTLRWREQKRKLMLGEASVALASSLDHEATLRRVAELAIPSFADWCVVHLEDGGVLRLAAAAHADPAKVARAFEVEQQSPHDPRVVAGVPHVVRTGTTQWMRDVPDEILVQIAHDDEHLRLIRAQGFRSFISTPLRARDRILGAITFVMAESGRQYDEGDVHFAEELARSAAMAVDNSRLHRETALAAEQAREAVRVRDEFLQIASHELKTPLTPLQLQLDAVQRALARQGIENDELNAKVATAMRQTMRLARLVESLLDLSRITSGRVVLERERLDLGGVVRDTAERFRPEARRVGTELIVHAVDEMTGRWDRLRVEQILSNLISNAIKYGRGGAIEIDAEASDEIVRVSVKDHGIGIEEEALGRIFERFERAVSSRHFGGLGLGLFVARQFAEAHGGSIVAHSRPGKGSTFTLVLPRQQEERAAASPDDVAPM